MKLAKLHNHAAYENIIEETIREKEIEFHDKIAKLCLLKDYA